MIVINTIAVISYPGNMAHDRYIAIMPPPKTIPQEGKTPVACKRKQIHSKMKFV
jgi:hypothetical protein